MANFKNNRKSFGGRSGGSRFGRSFPVREGGSRFRRRDGGKSRADYEMHSVTCDKCGQVCEVPFKPTGNKPVFCSDCFKKDERPRGRGQAERPARSELDYINAKLDKIMKALKIE